MRIDKLAEEIHANAVAHGWWDEEREMPEIIALIHSEWSEALEEAREGRPLVWRLCIDCGDGPCTVTPDMAIACGYHEKEGSKPEGVAVELIDGAIRILDALGAAGATFTDRETGRDSEIEGLYIDEVMARETPQHLPTLVAILHAQTSQMLLETEDGEYYEAGALMSPLATALTWVRLQGIDPLALLMEKHEYNKGRPYKHGKRF